MFNSFKWAMLVLANLAIALVGVMVALYLTGNHFSGATGVGLLALFGVSVPTGVIRALAPPARTASKDKTQFKCAKNSLRYQAAFPDLNNISRKMWRVFRLPKEDRLLTIFTTQNTTTSPHTYHVDHTHFSKTPTKNA